MVLAVANKLAEVGLSVVEAEVANLASKMECATPEGDIVRLKGKFVLVRLATPDEVKEFSERVASERDAFWNDCRNGSCQF